MSTPEPTEPQITLENEDCAVVFHSDGTLNLYVPSREEGESIPTQMLLAMLVQEMLKDHFMIKVLTDRLMQSGLVGPNSEVSEVSA